MTATAASPQTARVLRETATPLSKAAAHFPPGRAGKPVESSTIQRWVTAGVGLPDGSRLKLEAAKCGGLWYTSTEAITRFIAGQQPASEPSPDLPVPRTPSARRRASEAAEAELVARGC